MDRGFLEGDRVVLVQEFAVSDLHVRNGDQALVLGVSDSGETLHVSFDKWSDVGSPSSAHARQRANDLYGQPYYVYRAFRFKHKCLFNEGGDAYKDNVL
jgi:hypothetical protein